jgi:hypothetical protein
MIINKKVHFDFCNEETLLKAMKEEIEVIEISLTDSSISGSDGVRQALCRRWTILQTEIYKMEGGQGNVILLTAPHIL